MLEGSAGTPGIEGWDLMSIQERIQEGSACVAIVGLGRVGLPLAVAFADAGFRVFGVDVDPDRRQTVELGKLPFLELNCEDLLSEAITSGKLTVHATPDEVVPQADAVILCVGTPLGADLRADYTDLRSALSSLVSSFHPGQLIVLRSTVSPGTLRKVVAPLLAHHAPDLAPTLLLAVCPERIAEGRAMEELRSLPEIIGGMDEESTAAAAALFGVLGPEKKLHLVDSTSAELAKLMTNVYRYVSFALANEFAILGEYYGVDSHRVIQVLNDGYPRAGVPRPGLAGGPCLSKDGYFLVEELTLPDFVLLAWKLNDSAPAYVVRRLMRRLSRHGVEIPGAPIAVLGQAFKRDIDDARQSPSVRLAEILRREGAEVRVHDPYLETAPLDEVLSGARAFVLATNHSSYDSLDPHEVRDLMIPPFVGLDCWGVLDRSRFAAAGVEVIAFGVGEEL
jgi:UDP-N-acetyl-D-mannosaminuronic acid dehydrogenase